ncbi:His-Xaa-Ser system radical SAM maturase HxsB [Nitrincola sp.]|uniref:His-Xaa-Ser system radical SAM maturase HxsB n=1 Tax=Nitrincola sp. TaxID=1926584 RepID=UPI003A94E558
MRLLPFEFERIADEKVFISNLSGFNQILNTSDFDLLCSDTGKISESLLTVLQSKHFLAAPENISASETILAAGYGKKLVSELVFRPVFMVVPTLRCDHTCTYCQVARAPIDRPEFDMSPELITNTVERIAQIGVAPYVIEIQGGEPLLRFDLIKQLYSECEDQLGVGQFNVVIASTLSLLTDEILEWCKPRRVEFSFSLDGDASIHDNSRILASDSSYSRAIHGARSVMACLGPDRLGVVTTVTKALLTEPEKLIEGFREAGLRQFFVRPISPYGFAKNWQDNSYTLSEYFDFYRRFLQELKKQWEAGYGVGEHSFKVHVKRLSDPRFNCYADLKSPSGFGLNTLLFNFDGKIYGSDEARMLQRLHPEIDFSLGPIDSPELVISELTHSIIDGGINFDKPGCSSCAFQPYCGGDPMQNISLFGEPIGDKSLSHFCEYHRGMFKLVIAYLSGDRSDQAFAAALADE